MYFNIQLEGRHADVDKYPVFLIGIYVKGNCTRIFHVRESEREKDHFDTLVSLFLVFIATIDDDRCVL
jgi:hypothetical protein